MLRGCSEMAYTLLRLQMGTARQLLRQVIPEAPAYNVCYGSNKQSSAWFAGPANLGESHS